MTDRLEEAERQLRGGNSEEALQLLRRERHTFGVQRDVERMRAIVDLARRVEAASLGTTRRDASRFVFAAGCDLAFAERQNAFVRERVEAARAALAAGDPGKASAALEEGLRKELEKVPRSRSRAVLEEISALAAAIEPSAGRKSTKLAARVLADAGSALTVAPASAPPRSIVPADSASERPGPPVPGGGDELTSRLDAFEEQIRSLETALSELRDKELPELRALVAGDTLVLEPDAVAPIRVDPAPRPIPVPSPAAPPAPAPAAVVPKPAEPARPPLPAAAPVRVTPAPAARRARPRPPRVTLAQLQDPRVLAWAGGIVTLLGIIFISVLAADRGWVSAELRVVLGALVSAALYGAGLVAYRRYGPTWAALAAAGAGIGGAYATLAAAGAVYDFVGKPQALLAAAFVAAVGVATAVRWDTQMTAVLGLVGAMLGPVLIEGDVTSAGSAFAAIVLGATVAVTVWSRWLETMAIGGLVAFALAVGLLVEQDPGHDAAAAVVAAAFSVLFLAAGTGHEVRRSRSSLAKELAPVAIGAFLMAGTAIPLAVTFELDSGSSAGVPAALAVVWLVDLAGAIGYQLARGRGQLQRVASALLFAAVALSFATTLRFFEGRQQGLALLGTAAVYLACLPLLRGRGQRDLMSALGAVALTAIAVGVGDLLSGNELALVWAAEGGLLSWLAAKTKETRLFLAALGYLGLALGQTLVLDAAPSELFIANDDPAEGVPAALYTAAGFAVFAACYRHIWVDKLSVRGVEVRLPSGWLGSLCSGTAAFALTLYAASLALLGLVVELAGDGFEPAFERGHAAVSALWAVVAFSLLLVGLLRRSVTLHAAGLALFFVTLVKLLYDLATLSPVNRSYSFLAVGAVALAACFVEAFLGEEELRARPAGFLVDPLSVAFGLVSLVLLPSAVVELLDGRMWTVDRQGGGLLVLAAVYGALAAVLFRTPDRDLSVTLWVPAALLGAVSASELLDGRWLVLAWSCAAVAFVALAYLTAEPRFSLAALAYLGLAVAHVLNVDAPPRELFVATDDPATGVPAVLFAAIASVILGLLYRPPDRSRGAVLPYPSRSTWSAAAYLAAGALTLYAATLSILGLAVAVMADGETSVEEAFDRGHPAVTSLWGLVALALVSLGLRRRANLLHLAGVTLYALAAVELVGFDIPELSPSNAAFAALGLGFLALAAGFEQGRLSRAAIRGIRIDPLAAAFVTGSLALLVPAIVVLLEGRTWALDREGAGLLAAALAYGALGAFVLRENRDFSTVLWAPALALGAAAAPLLLGDPWRALVWSAAGATLAWLAGRSREPRFVPASGAFVALALTYALGLEVPPKDLFVVQGDPAAGLASLVFATLGAYAFAAILAGLSKTIALWTAGALSVYAASIAILGGFQSLAADDPSSIEDAFQRGHTAVSSFWAVVGLMLLSIGLRRDSRDFRVGGLVLFWIALAKLFLYDLSTLSALARALSFLGVGVVLLLAAFLYQRVSSGAGAETGGQPRPEGS